MAVAGVERVVVVGSGAMGRQIGGVFALAGFSVAITDVAEAALERGRAEMDQRIRRLAEKRAISDEDAIHALARITWTTDLAACAAQADLFVEAASERLELKRELFGRLGELAPRDAILTTNSSTIPSSLVAADSGRPDRVCNLHFFNPALVMDAVEVVPNPHTSTETMETVGAIVRAIGKHAITLTTEVPGFVANRLMVAVLDEAVSLYANGVASIEDIDAAARLALGHPLGPFQLMDLVGIDVVYLMHQATHAITGADADLPHPALAELYEAGRWGRKTSQGWYAH